MNRALVTGVSGQLGFYLSQELRSQGVKVYGLVAPQGGIHIPGGSEVEYVKRELPYVQILLGDLLDYPSLATAICEAKPDMIFLLGAISQPAVGEAVPELMMQVNAMGTVRMLEAAKLHAPYAKIVHLSSDAIFGEAPSPQDAETPLAPRSTYALSKAMAHLAIDTARVNGRWAANAVLFNAVSPRQTTGFLPHLVRQAVLVKRGLKEKVAVRTLGFRRDILHTRDVARALLCIANQRQPWNVAVGSGVSISGESLCSGVFWELGLSLDDHLQVEVPEEIDATCPSASTERLRKFGWLPSCDIATLVREMVDFEVARAESAIPSQN